MPGALIGIGSVWHRRLRPAPNAFAYAACFLMLPMRRLRERPDPALARNRFGLFAFADRDHGDGGPDALAWAERLLASEGIVDADGEIWLQTFPRVLGHAFKPVSFWYAQRTDGTLAAVLAEVNNTFGERHVYLLAGPRLGWGREAAARKVFHVSPFCAVQGRYRFRFIRNGDRIVACVDHDDDAGPLLLTRLSGDLAPLTAARIRRAFFGQPLMSLAVVARIHWQALRLALKHVPFFSKPAPPGALTSR